MVRPAYPIKVLVSDIVVSPCLAEFWTERYTYPARLSRERNCWGVCGNFSECYLTIAQRGPALRKVGARCSERLVRLPAEFSFEFVSKPLDRPEATPPIPSPGSRIRRGKKPVRGTTGSEARASGSREFD